MVRKPSFDDSRNQIASSINFNWWLVKLRVAKFTEYGFTTVDATIPINVAPIKNGFTIWYGDRPAPEIIINSDDFVRVYETTNVPMNTANGKNIGIYSNNLVQASNKVDKASGLEDKRSTKVTAKMIPQTVSITIKKLLKKRRIRNLVKTLGLNIYIIYIL